MSTWRRSGHIIREYANDHPHQHVHVYRGGRQLDRFDLTSRRFLDGTIGAHRGRVLKVLRDPAREGAFDPEDE
jgi:hypothetical protein